MHAGKILVEKIWTVQGTNQNAPFHPGPVQPYHNVLYYILSSGFSTEGTELCISVSNGKFIIHESKLFLNFALNSSVLLKVLPV